MTARDSEETEKLDSALVAALFLEYEGEVKRFLWGVLRDNHLTNDVLQAAFVKMIEHGHTTREETRKAWLFRVAYHEALALRRREKVGKRARDQVARQRSAGERPSASPAAEEPLIRLETLQAVRKALEGLPAEQRRVVAMRVYEEKTFAQIAEELNIPLGTALGRMRLALAKLRKALPDQNS